MTWCRDESLGLACAHRATRVVMALHDVRMQRLVREEDHERRVAIVLQERHHLIREHVGHVPIHDMPLPVDVQ